MRALRPWRSWLWGDRAARRRWGLVVLALVLGFAVPLVDGEIAYVTRDRAPIAPHGQTRPLLALLRLRARGAPSGDGLLRSIPFAEGGPAFDERPPEAANAPVSAAPG